MVPDQLLASVPERPNALRVPPVVCPPAPDGVDARDWKKWARSGDEWQGKLLKEYAALKPWQPEKIGCKLCGFEDRRGDGVVLQ